MRAIMLGPPNISQYVNPTPSICTNPMYRDFFFYFRIKILNVKCIFKSKSNYLSNAFELMYFNLYLKHILFRNEFDQRNSNKDFLL